MLALNGERDLQVAAEGSCRLTAVVVGNCSRPLEFQNSLTNVAAAVTNGYFTVTLDFGNVFDGE